MQEILYPSRYVWFCNRMVGGFRGLAILRGFRPPELSAQHVYASRAQIQGEHLVLFNAQGKLAAFFSLDSVESWNALARLR